MKRFVYGAVFAVASLAAFILGDVLHSNPPPSDAEVAYRLERVGQREISRIKLLVDEVKLHVLTDGGWQCIPPAALPNIIKWGEKCTIPDCTIEVDGKPFVAIVLPPKTSSTSSTSSTPPPKGKTKP